jgi:hypothetical protein
MAPAKRIGAVGLEGSVDNASLIAGFHDRGARSISPKKQPASVGRNGRDDTDASSLDGVAASIATNCQFTSASSLSDR